MIYLKKNSIAFCGGCNCVCMSFDGWFNWFNIICNFSLAMPEGGSELFCKWSLHPSRRLVYALVTIRWSIILCYNKGTQRPNYHFRPWLTLRVVEQQPLAVLGALETCSPSVQFIFYFHAAFGKKLVLPFGVGSPCWKSWIHHWQQIKWGWERYSWQYFWQYNMLKISKNYNFK